MTKIVKNYFVGILLLLFLFPQVQKGVHDFSHRHDTHCDAKAEKHFHTFEHVCSLCDFSVPVSTEFQTFHFSLFEKISENHYRIPHVELIISDCFLQLPPRAPPVFVS